MAERPRQGGTDSVKLGDGTVVQIARLPEVDENTWGEMKNYLERNPEIARGLSNFSKNPEAMRGWLQTQAMAEHYQSKLEADDQTTKDMLNSLEEDPELRHVFEEIKRSGISAAMKFWDDEELLLKISAHMGGVPGELQSSLRRIADTPLSLHEAARNGDSKAIAEYLRKGQAVDGPDAKGITPLGYALGSGRSAAAVKLLLESRASFSLVDSNGNSGLHYAAGYGHKELVEYLLRLGASLASTNTQGQTSHDLASVNGHREVMALLATR